MLPSTGLFREFKCPFYDGNEENAATSCPRPFCHFKHARKDAEPQKNEKPQYCATPMTSEERPLEMAKKKPKLEYIPLPTVKSRIEYNPGSVEETVPTETAEENQETPKNVENKENIENKDKENISEKAEENMVVDEIKEEEKKPEEVETKSKTSRSSSSGSSSRHKHKSSHHSSQRSSSSTHKSSSSSSSKTSASHKSSHHKSSRKEDDGKKKDEKSSRSNSKEKSSRSNSKEKSSSSKDKDKSSRSNSKEKEKSSRSNSKEKEKISVKEEKTSSKEENRKSSSKSKEKLKSDEDRKKHERHKSTGKASKSNDRKSSSKSKERSSRDRRKEERKKKEEEKREEHSPSPELLISDLESDEDDVMEQCKAIFEEYTPDTNGKKDEPKESKRTECEPVSTDEEPVDCGKKRVARDGAIKPLIQPPQKNLKLNPMQQIYKRQEVMRKMAAEATSPTNLPPIKARPNIAPVSNMLAMKYAKAKIDALRQAQHKPTEPAPSTSKTMAQTSSKFYGRVAHITRAPEPESKPAPPVLEPTSTKISYNVRMQYYNMMVKHCLIMYPNCEDAFNRAQVEELAAMKKCNTVNIYKSSALLTVNKLRKEAIDSGNTTDEKKTISHDLIIAGKQSTSWSVNKKLKTDRSQVIGNFDIMPGEKAYKLVADCLASEEQLRAYGYPRGTPGTVKIHSTKRPLPPNKDERYCCRCSKIFNPEIYDEIHVDECNYHPKSAGFKRGSADNFHYCCQQPTGTAGCMYSNYHVTDWLDYDNLKGFVRTLEKEDEEFVLTKKDIFAFDCEMCYTRGGFELTRITVVNFEEKVVYDTLVRPDNEVVDYNTTYSGITEELLSKVKTSIREVQAVLLSMFHADTILIGHSLESDMKAVKLLHDKVVDTAMLFPHKMGFPKKRALKTLCVENLKRIIQENDGGHDSSEDAIACIQLVKHYLRNRII